jgi:hypothetical protein
MEGHEGVKWELGFAFISTGKEGFTALVNHWDKKILEMGMGFLFFSGL